MDYRLHQHLSRLSQRYQRVRLWNLLALVWLSAAVVAAILLGLKTWGAWSLPADGWVVAIVAAALTLLVTVTVRRSFRDYHWIAQRVEHQFPSLEQRLITAIAQRPTTADGQYGFLQATVVDEAVRHAHRHFWAATVPRSRIARARWLNVPAFALFAVILVGLFLTEMPPPQVAELETPSAPAASKDLRITVEPGNTELERGTSLIVLARFEGAVPGEVHLAVSGDEQHQKIAMTRSLDDPTFGGHVADVTDDLTYHVEYAGRRSESYRVTVFDYPELLRADALLSFPDYTQLPERRVEDTRRVTAVEGSQLTWICHLNKSVASAQLVDKQGKSIALTPDGLVPNAYSTGMRITESLRWRLEVVDEAGRKNKYPPELVAKVIPNQPPELTLAMARDVRVSPLEELPVQASVRDDFGVRQLGVTYAIPGQEQQDVVLGESIARRERRDADHIIDFEALEAEPDQFLSYHFWAEDHGPDGQPRRTFSDMFFAEVRHFEEIFRQGEQQPGGQQQNERQQQQGGQNGEQAEQLAELQKQIINGTWKVIRRESSAQPTDIFSDDVTLLRDSQSTAFEQLESLGRRVRDDESRGFVDAIRGHMLDALEHLRTSAEDTSVEPLQPALAAEQASYQALLKLRAREFEVTRGQQQSNRSSNRSRSSSSANRFRQQLQELELDNDQNRYETERQAQTDQQQQEEQQQRELRQVLNRLRELARRQEDLNEQLKQLQSALEAAEDEAQREEIRRQLQRLRDQQQQLLRDTDELAERMDQPQLEERLQESRERLDETREDVRRSSEALSQNDVPQSLAAGTRAEREFERMRDEVRRQTANEFSEEMREMRQQAQQLDEQQQELGQRLAELQQDRQNSLRRSAKRDEVQDGLGQQQQELTELLERVQKTVEDSEASEPLLAQKLYDSYRETRQRNVNDNLESAAQLLRRGLDPQAGQLEEEAREGINELREDIDEAAESVLGDETEALKRALAELDELSRQLDNEIAREDPTDDEQRADDSARNRRPGTRSPTDSNDQRNENRDQPSAEERTGGEESPPRRGNRDETVDAERGNSGRQQNPRGDRPNETQNRDRQRGEGRPRQSGRRPSGRETGGLERFANENLGSAPLTGDDFRDWSDRLRDVEEMVDDAELRSEAAAIRDRARSIRLDVTRHSKQPQWPLVRKLVAKPLKELRQRVSDELIRRSAERNEVVPIDRDPVPDRFAEQVRRYFEQLGSGN